MNREAEAAKMEVRARAIATQPASWEMSMAAATEAAEQTRY